MENVVSYELVTELRSTNKTFLVGKLAGRPQVVVGACWDGAGYRHAAEMHLHYGRTATDGAVQPPDSPSPWRTLMDDASARVYSASLSFPNLRRRVAFVYRCAPL